VQAILTWIKDNKRIFFNTLAILVVVANMFGFAEFTLDPNIAIVVVSGVTLLLSLLRKYFDI